MKRLPGIIAIVLAIFAGFPVAADDPVPGVFLAVPGALAGTPFASPDFLFRDDPRSSVWNPAADADRALPAFGVAAALAFPAGSGEGAGGYAALSASIPTSIGTAWAVIDGNLKAPDLYSWGAPTGTSIVGGLSKRVSDRLSLGVGAGGAAADIEGREWTVSASLGAELALPQIASGGSDLALAVLGMGPSLGGGEGSDPLVAPTPAVSWRSRLIETERFSVSVSALLALPAFSDLAFAAGTSFSLGSYLNLDLGWHWSTAESRAWDNGGPFSDEYAFRAFPSVSISFDGSSFLRLGGFGTSLAVTGRPAGAGAAVVEAAAVFSRGERDTEGPEVYVGTGSQSVFSPAIVPAVTFPFSVRDASRIVEWTAVVYGNDGGPVHTFGAMAPDVMATGILRRLFSRESSADIPTELNLPLSTKVGDGEYRLRAWARDEYGNVGNAAELLFVVDGTAPQASARIEGPGVFSPNGDGAQDALTVVQEGGAEALWTGIFRSAAGVSVRTFRWTDSPPDSFSWDGRSDSGEVLDSGFYEYELMSTDAAGNRGTVRITGIELDLEPTPLRVSLDGRSFSTDSDAAATSVLLTIDAPRKRGLSAWNIAVVGELGKAVMSWSGSTDRLDVLPTTLRFDGRDRRAEHIADGRYRFRVDLSYINGNKPSAVSSSFIVDSKRPIGRVRASSAAFIPDRGDRVTLFHNLSPGAEWRGIVKDEQDRVVVVLPLGSDPETVIEWNGLDAAGLPVGEGRYRYVAEGKNAVGLIGTTPAVSLRVDSGGFSATLIADRIRFSAKSGDTRVRFLPRIERRDRLVSYALEIKNVASKAVVRRYDGIAVLPAAMAWDGRDEAGLFAADGDYAASLSVLFEGGERAIVESPVVSLDSTPPRATLALARTVFSPNGDGVLDSVDIAQRDALGANLWAGVILDEHGDIVRSYSWKNAPPAILSWDGFDEDGGLFPDGSYRYRLSSVDAAGNAFSAESPAFRLDARVPSGTIAVDKRAISPNGDGFADSLLVRLVPSFLDGLERWTVDIVDDAGSPVRHLAGGRSASSAPVTSPPAEFRWDGGTEAGTRVVDGQYRVVAALQYAKGDTLRMESPPFIVDATPPSVAAVFSPLPFSPDGDGVADELFISIEAQDGSALAGWMLLIIDPAGYPFTTFSGKSLPSEPFPWDGRNLQGELVEAAQDYSYELIVRDVLGNARKVSGSIPVDVFVLQDGDRLKIRISSIVFAPSSASLTSGETSAVAKNAAVLDRIATVLGRFPGYRIRVEGHAVNVTGTEREERTELAELSLSRARSVMDALAARGVELTRLEARGLGGREPIVPHGDVEARWRNRRVEFILVR